MMQHLNSGSFEFLMQAGVDEEEVLRATEHLRSCEACRQLLRGAPLEAEIFFSQLLVESKVPRGYDINAYSAALDGVVRRLSAESAQLEGERDSAPALLQELEKFPIEQKQLLVRNSGRFRSWGLAEYLLEASRESWTDDPLRSERLALLALEVIENLPVDKGYREKVANDLRAEAWSFVGNSRRIQGKSRASAKAFHRAEECLKFGTGDVLERARVLDLKASLMRHQGRYADAQKLLNFAISVYRSSGEKRLEAKALLGFGKLYSDMGEAELFLPLVQRATDLLREEGDHFLELVAKVQTIYCLMEVGRASEASALIPELRSLVSAYGGRLDRLRLLWQEGKVCQALGQVELAEQALLQARDGFAAASLGYDVALVSLDLAALYLEEGRIAEVKELALNVVPRFAAEQVHPDAFTAIALFEQAARKERATLSLVEEVAAKVRDCQVRKLPKRS